MFHLLAGIYDHCFLKTPIRILTIGLDGSGKTVLLNHDKSTEVSCYYIGLIIRALLRGQKNC